MYCSICGREIDINYGRSEEQAEYIHISVDFEENDDGHEAICAEKHESALCLAS